MNLTVLVLFCFIIIGIGGFWIGFHNMDVCHNEALISCSEDVEIYELALDGRHHSLTDCYLLGIKLLLAGFHMTLFSCVLLGYYAKEGEK